MITGGSGFNIIADKVQIIGTTRSFTQQTQELIKTRMQCICCGVGATYGGEIDLEYNCKSLSCFLSCGCDKSIRCWGTLVASSARANVEFYLISFPHRQSLHADGYPATDNKYPECTAAVRAAATKIVGEKRAAAPQKTMGAEDFSFFLEERPGNIFWVDFIGLCGFWLMK